ncbi:MAG: SAM-dependent methyltransferase [Acidimicrobiales bacterium]|nr:SAM-dependent methyltransferase [Acidimicrobiales bacterium]
MSSDVAGRPPWNHNIAYHRLVLAAAPARRHRALDVGCGQGHLLPHLAAAYDDVIGLDTDEAALTEAAHRVGELPNVTLIRGDVTSAELPHALFDLVSAVAVLHHLPLRSGLARLADLVRPGGCLVVVGLARSASPLDYAWGAAGLPVSKVLRLVRGHTPVTAPIVDPTQTLADIRQAAAEITPGARIRRHLLFRYSLTWTRPPD